MMRPVLIECARRIWRSELAQQICCAENLVLNVGAFGASRALIIFHSFLFVGYNYNKNNNQQDGNSGKEGKEGQGSS